MPTPGRRRPSTVETRWRTPAIGRSSRNVLTRTDPGTHTRPRSFRSRSTIITCSARSLPLAAIGSVESAGRVPLIGIVQTRSPRVRRKSSGVAETIDQPSPCIAARELGAERRQRPLDPRRVALERRAHVLDEVHLVDVAAPDRSLHLGDRRRMLPAATTSAPTPPPRTAQQRGQTPMLRARPRRFGRRRPGAGTAPAGRRRRGRSRGRGRPEARGGRPGSPRCGRTRPASGASSTSQRPSRSRVGRAVPMPYRRAGERPRAAAGSRLRLQRHHLRRRAAARRALRPDLRRDRDRGHRGALLQRVRRLLRPRDRRARSGRRRPARPRRRASGLLDRRTELYLARAGDGRDRAPAGRGMRARDRRARAGRGRLGRRPARRSRPCSRAAACAALFDVPSSRPTTSRGGSPTRRAT